MSHYRSNLRDIEFNLFEFLNIQDHLGRGPFSALDVDTAKMLIREVDRFSRESIWAESFVPADREPLQLDPETGNVTVPEPLHEALQAFYDAGWHTIALPPHLGGASAPPTIRWATTELFAGGHATASLWPIGALMGWIVDRLGTEGQRKRFARTMVEKRWGGTMVLTEPDAGSDVGAGVTKAVKVEDNGPEDLGSVWHLEGVKRFITSADYQGHKNTVHMVLARPEGGTAGTKGLRLFIVPKFLVNLDGSLGERNGVYVSNLEKKMGIKGSATCELTFGQREPCVGYLVGDVDQDGAGIRQMFMVIEYARMMVGTKAMATLSTGYLNALDYAKVRVQGPDMTQMADKTAKKVAIINHPDVRRMLMEQKAHAEGMRALCMWAGWVQDMAQMAKSEDEPDSTPEGSQSDHDAWLAREDLLLPLVKGYCSEKAYELLTLSLQTFGGSGFTKDYPIEQYIRDAKIDSLYEGTTTIQALDLVFRKIIRDQGTQLNWGGEQIREFVKGGGSDDPFASERAYLGQALEDTQAHLGSLIRHAMASMNEEMATEIYKVGLNTTEFLYSVAETLIAWLLLRQAEVAQHYLDTGINAPDADFYTGKVAAARYFARTVLPKTKLRREKAETEDGALMEVPESAF